MPRLCTAGRADPAARGMLIGREAVAEGPLTGLSFAAIERTVPQIPLTPQMLDQLITATTMPYALERVSRTGPQLLVMVEPGFNAESPTALGLRYLLLRWLDGNRLPEFVREFTKVQSFPMPKLE